MAAARKSPEEKAVRVNISIPQSVLVKIDENVDKVQKWLVAHSVDEKKVQQVVTRSSILRELIISIGTPTGYHSLCAGFALQLGAVDNGQMDLFD